MPSTVCLTAPPPPPKGTPLICAVTLCTDTAGVETGMGLAPLGGGTRTPGTDPVPTGGITLTAPDTATVDTVDAATTAAAIGTVTGGAEEEEGEEEDTSLDCSTWACC